MDTKEQINGLLVFVRSYGHLLNLFIFYPNRKMAYDNQSLIVKNPIRRFHASWEFNDSHGHFNATQVVFSSQYPARIGMNRVMRNNPMATGRPSFPMYLNEGTNAWVTIFFIMAILLWK